MKSGFYIHWPDQPVSHERSIRVTKPRIATLAAQIIAIHASRRQSGAGGVSIQ
jgi:hypothetical protein